MTELRRRSAIVVGGGPAGLAATEVLAEAGWRVTIHERMPNPARKFLLAGRGGLNLTHSEPLDDFLSRYGTARQRLEPAIRAFTPDDLRAWAARQGIATFVGSSGRVFPTMMKASPLLRAWLEKLRRLGVELVTGSRWTGWDGDAVSFETSGGVRKETPDALVLALGGASWPRLGSDGSWTRLLVEREVKVTPLQAANSGFVTGWSDVFRKKFEGEALKGAVFSLGGCRVRGDVIIAGYGIEGGPVYALGPAIRRALRDDGEAILEIDLAPDVTTARLGQRLGSPGHQSIANRLRRAGLSPVAAGLIREDSHGRDLPQSVEALADRIKSCRLRLSAAGPVERAISTSGGICWESVNTDYSLKGLPNVFVAGEMLDWDAPTGGYLLQACLATGRAAGHGAAATAA